VNHMHFDLPLFYYFLLVIDTLLIRQVRLWFSCLEHHQDCWCQESGMHPTEVCSPILLSHFFS